MDEFEDAFDYPMSDAFVSETRPRPYRTGFRSRRHPRCPSLSHINSLSDREFTDYIRKGCRLRDSSLAVKGELDELRAQLRELQAEMRALRHAMTKTAPSGSAKRGGLDVAPRT